MKIERLFGSRTRVKIVQLLFLHPEKALYIREIARMLDEQMNAVRRELENCEQLGVVSSEIQARKKYYRVQKSSPLVAPLRDLLVTAQFLLEPEYLPALQTSGRLYQVMLLGFFMNQPDAPVDICIIGDVTAERIKKQVEIWEKAFFTHLKFTSMTTEEYRYRNSISDRFVYSITQSQHIVIFKADTPG